MVLTVVPLVFLLLLFALTAVLVGELSDSERIGEQSAKVLGRSAALSESITVANRSLVAYTKSHREADAAEYWKVPATIRAESTELVDATAGSPPLAAAAMRYVNSIAGVSAVLQQYYDDVHQRRDAAAKAVGTDPRTQKIAAEFNASRIALDSLQQTETLQRLSTKRATFWRIEAAMIVVALAGSIATIAVAGLFGFRMVRRLEILSGNARRMATGEPAVDVAGTDEIAELDRVYREMAAQMRETHRERETAVAALEQERTIASTLQQALLPSRLPEIPGLRFDSAYVTPLEGIEIGGDWFDVFMLDERHVGFSVGDVAGHGLRAAVTMGTMRQSIRTAARIERAPGRVLAHVNRMICADDPGALVTAFFGVFDGVSPRDDSAVLVVSVLTAAREGLAQTQAWSFDARDSAETHRVRRAVVMQLEDVMPASHRFNVEVIIGEVLSNIARHTPGPARIVTEQLRGTIALHIEDEGPPYELGDGGEPEMFSESGRGLVLMRSLSDGLRLSRTLNGNRLTILFRTPANAMPAAALLERA